MPDAFTESLMETGTPSRGPAGTPSRNRLPASFAAAKLKWEAEGRPGLVKEPASTVAITLYGAVSVT